MTQQKDLPSKSDLIGNGSILPRPKGKVSAKPVLVDSPEKFGERMADQQYNSAIASAMILRDFLTAYGPQTEGGGDGFKSACHKFEVAFRQRLYRRFNIPQEAIEDTSKRTDEVARKMNTIRQYLSVGKSFLRAAKLGGTETAKAIDVLSNPKGSMQDKQKALFTLVPAAKAKEGAGRTKGAKGKAKKPESGSDSAGNAHKAEVEEDDYYAAAVDSFTSLYERQPDAIAGFMSRIMVVCMKSDERRFTALAAVLSTWLHDHAQDKTKIENKAAPATDLHPTLAPSQKTKTKKAA